MCLLKVRSNAKPMYQHIVRYAHDFSRDESDDLKFDWKCNYKCFGTSAKTGGGQSARTARSAEETARAVQRYKSVACLLAFGIHERMRCRMEARIYDGQRTSRRNFQTPPIQQQSSLMTFASMDALPSS